MTAQEMARVLKGTLEDKKNLYDLLFAKVGGGEVLEDHEIVIMEALKKELTVKTQVVEMSASVIATGGLIFNGRV